MSTPDDLLFCEVAIRLGKVTKPQVEQALCRKADLEVQGMQFRIGEVLAALGFLERDVIPRVLEVQDRELFSCDQCGAHFLIGSLKPGSRIKCGKCAHVLTVPTPRESAPAAHPVPAAAAAPAAVVAPAPAGPPAPTPAGTPGLPAPAPARVGTTARRERRARNPKSGIGTRLGVAGQGEKDAPVDDKLLGAVVARCTLVQRLGVGGWGTVYRARHQVTGKDFAIKVLFPALAANEDTLQRFFREAKLTAQLTHPAIRSVFDAGVENNHHFMVMEYVDGDGLRTLVERDDPLDPESAVRLMLQVVSGLHHAAEGGITHRDIKPQNILVDRQGRAKITDFGLAKAAHDTAEITATATLIGTPEYMSPEQFEGRPADLRSDIYSLGCTFFFLLTGRPPFDGRDLFTLLQKHRNEPPPSPRKYNSLIPYALCKVLSRMLEKKPENRYAGYPELVGDLQASVAAGTVEALEPARGPAGESGEGSPLQRWLTEERLNQCAEIQKELIDLGFVPPAAAEILPRLGIETDMGRAPGPPEGDFTLVCGRCSRKTALSAKVVDGGFTCAGCRQPLVHEGRIALGKELCTVTLGFSGSRLDAVAVQELALLAEHLAHRFGCNLAFDLTRLEARGTADATLLAAGLQGLVGVPALLTLVPGDGKLRETLASLGIGEFLRVLEPGRTFVEALDGCALCPHAQEALGLLRGLAGFPEGDFPERIETGCRACPAGESFAAFYADLPDLVRKGSLEELHARQEALEAKIDAPCMREAATRVLRRAEEGIRVGLEKRAREYARQGNRALADKYAGLLLRWFAKHPASHDVAGCLALAQRAFTEAARAFGKAAELAEDPREYLLNRAAALQAGGDRASALKDLDEVVKRDPGNAQAILRRGLVQMEAGALAEAARDFDRALAITPDGAAALNARGKVRHRLGNLKGAADDFEAAARFEPTEATYHANCGAICVKLNEIERAARFLERALELQPSLTTPRYNLACIAVKRGDNARAMELLDAAVAGGFARLEVLRGDPDLAPLRALPEFAALLRKAEGAKGAGPRPA